MIGKHKVNRRGFLGASLGLATLLTNKTSATSPRDLENGQGQVVPVYGPQELTKPGAIYVLQNDINARGACFVFRANRITLDGNQHRVLGSPTQNDEFEVLVDGYDEAAIRDLEVFSGSGIGLMSTNRSVVENIASNGNNYGLCAHDISQCGFTGIETNANSIEGLNLSQLQENTINRVAASFNNINGVSIYRANGNTLRDIVTNSNGVVGLKIIQSLRNTFTSILSNNNRHAGIEVLMSSGNILEGIEADNNGSCGICFKNSPRNLVKNGGFHNPRYFTSDGFDVSLVHDSHDVIFMNCWYDTEFVEPGSSLIRAWSYKAKVMDPSGTPVANAKVSARDIYGSLALMVTTGIDGCTPELWLPSYINEGVKTTSYAPFEIRATKGSLSTSHIYDPDGSKPEDAFILTE